MAPKVPTAPHRPLSPAPVRRFRPQWIPAYLSNGLVGMRCGSIPLIEGLVTVSGLAQLHPSERVQGFARGPYPVGGDIQVGDHVLSRVPQLARLRDQVYDFSCGELRTRFQFGVGESRADVEVLTFCSRSQPSLVCQEVTLRVSAPCPVKVALGINHSGVPGSQLSRETDTPGAEQPVVEGILLWEPPGGLIRCGAAYVTSFHGGRNVERSVERFDHHAPLFTSHSFEAAPGRTYRFTQITSLVAGSFNDDPHRQATRLASLGEQIGWDSLREENRQRWSEIWQGRIRIDAADGRWQELADAAFYYLHASAHKSSLFSTAMFGLAYWPNYHYYEGHVMWDIETFALPVLLLTAPDNARSLLNYRSERLGAARRNAAINGYAGLQFPWASSPLLGTEANRTNAAPIIFEQHVNFSVALAFVRYAHATGDRRYVEEKVLPVLFGVCEWIEDRAVRTRRGYEIKRALGIAEQGGPVDNNAFVNMAAAVTLREAAVIVEAAGYSAEAQRWRAMAADIYIPVDSRSGVILQHDGFDPADKGVGAATPEPPFGIWPVGYEAPADVEMATMRFYLERLEPYIGYPMLNSVLGVYAARLGDRDGSLDLFQRGYADYINEPFRETDEFSRVRFPEKPRAGPMTANMSGFLLALLYGLPGLAPGPDDPVNWARRPVILPEGWKSIECDQIWARGRRGRLVARHGMERAELSFPS